MKHRLAAGSSDRKFILAERDDASRHLSAVVRGSARQREKNFVCRINLQRRKKGTLGITGLFLKREHIELGLGYIDVVLSRPYAEEGIKG